MLKRKWGGNMFDFFQKTKGSISLFLALIMLPMMTVAGLVVDGSRISAARTSISGAGDLAMNAALSEYDQILYDVYGLFAMSENMEELEKNCERYFRNSLENSGMLEDSDSYTREFINSIFNSLSSSDMDFSNIVDVDVDSFTLTGVESSALANPSVLERQIVDYMKYRAPINLGKGLLTKIGCIGETSKQTKAIEAKVDYDKKLDTVQDACKTAYDSINAYNDLVSGNGAKFKDDYISKLSGDISSAKTNVETMVKYILASKNESLKVSSFYNSSPGYKDIANILIKKKALSIFKLDSETKKAVEKYYKDSKSSDKLADVLNYLESAMSGSIKLKPLSDGTYDYERTDFINALLKLDSNYETELSAQINAIQLHNAVPGMKTMFTYTIMYANYYEQLPTEQQGAYKAKYDAYSELAQVMLASSEFCSSYSKEWKNNANTYGKKAADLLYAWYEEIEAINGALDDAVEALEAVKKKVGELDDARVNWSNKVDNLSESDVKTSMKGDYENSAKDINEDAINSLINVLNDNKKHFTGIKDKLDGIKLDGVKICFKAESSTDFVSRFSKLTSNGGNPASEAAQIMKSKYVNQDLTGLNPTRYTKIDETQQFYKYLVRVCASSDAESNKQSKSDAKDLKKTLIDKGNEGATSSAAALPNSVPSNIDDALPEDVIAAIDDLYSNEGGSNSTFEADNVDSGGKDSKIADQNKNNLSKISTLLESLANIAEAARDDLYVEEYLTEMFSCFTDTIEKDGKVVAKAMNGKDMTSNKFFGAETEYILWGKNDVQGNLNSTKAMIFGIRFALNSIYAFTSTDTRTPALTAATAIAGWTGFGVPIVQSVILLAWSMSESYVDVTMLCEGKSVALYKSKDTWYLGYGGLKATIASGIDKIVDKGLNDIFDTIENAAIDASGKVIDSIETDINRYTTNTLSGIYESVQSAIAVPVEQLALQIAGASQELSKNDIVEKLEKTLSDLKGSNSGLVNECVNQALSSLLSTKVGVYADKLYELYESSKNGSTIDVINEMLYGQNGDAGIIGELKNEIETSISDKVEEYGSKFKNDISSSITAGGDKVKENIKDRISKFTSGISGDPSDVNKGSTSAATGFTMNYKEYVKVFVMIHLMVSDNNKNAMLMRAAELIQANVSQQSSSFNVAKAYTVIETTATVNVRTTFFSVPVTTTGTDGNVTYSLDFSNIGSGKQKIKYTSVLGY